MIRSCWDEPGYRGLPHAFASVLTDTISPDSRRLDRILRAPQAPSEASRGLDLADQLA